MDSLLDFDQEYLGPPWGPYGRDLTLGFVSLASKFIMQVLNSTKVLNHNTYQELVLNRPQGVGLLTISNHTRCVTGCSSCCCYCCHQQSVVYMHCMCSAAQPPPLLAQQVWLLGACESNCCSAHAQSAAVTMPLLLNQPPPTDMLICYHST
eukprot:GHRQ01039280.1.p1 GENE.GHRQ01039280.1~~GHRQ01039280.1.p1  ORF type:complete len:151 (-),score=9.98 GHRQ01039280.1:36-488(-)